MVRFRTFLLPVGLLLLILLAACTGQPAPTATPAPTMTLPPTATPAPLPTLTPTVGTVPQAASGRDPAAQGTLRVIQAAPETTAIDVYLEQALIASRLGFGAFTNPVGVNAGTFYLQVVPTNALPNSQILADTTIAIEADHAYLILVTGTEETLTVSVFEENLSPLAEGETRLSFIHAVPRGPAFTPQIDRQPLGDNLEFGAVSVGYTIEAAAHQLAFYAGDTLLADIDTALAPQQMYTAVLTGAAGGGDYRVLLFNTPITTPGQVRFVHAAADMPAVDVYLDDTTLMTAASYRTANDWAELKPRTYRLRILPAGAPLTTAPLAETRFSMAANQALEIMLLMDRGNPLVRIYTHSLAATPAQTARLVVVNTVPDAPAIYARVLADPLDEIPMIPQGNNSRVLDFRAGPIELLWVTGQDNNARIVERAGEITFEAGYTYTYVVTGTEDTPFLLSSEVGIDEEVATVTGDESEGSTDEGNMTSLRAINALAEPLRLRIRLDGDVVLDELDTFETSTYTRVPEAEFDLRVESSGESTNAPAFYVDTLSLLNKQRETLLLYGTTEEMAISLLPDYDQPVANGQAILRVIHAVPEREDLTIEVDLPGIASTAEPGPTPDTGGTPVAPIPETPASEFQRFSSSAFGPGEATRFIGLPTGSYDIRVITPRNSRVVAIIPSLMLESQTVYDLLLLPGAGESFEIELLRAAAPE
jgi:hypothetical protein